MKKSLQYVLIMSALGLQSGVLLAQSELAGAPEMVGQAMDAGISIFDLRSMLDSAKRKGHGKGFNDELYQIYLSDIKDQPPQNKFNSNALMELEYQNSVLVLNVLVGHRKGVEFLNKLQDEVRKKIVKEAVEHEFFEQLRYPDQGQGQLFIMATQSLVLQL